MSHSKYSNLGLENPTLKAMHERTNDIVEKCTKIGSFAIKNVIVLCLLLPKVIVNFFIYLTTDSGNDVFDLPVPIWQVFHFV